MNKNRKIILIVIAIFLIISVILLGRFLGKEKIDRNVLESPAIITNQSKPDTSRDESETITQSSEEKIKPTPKSTSISVPFTTQAPFANWDAAHEEACEEASLIMLAHFKKNTGFDSLAAQDKEINDLINYETENGYKVDITLNELASIAKGYYNLGSGRVEKNISIEAIKRELAEGRPVIVPAAGKLLANPNFKNGGPLYHMLVIKGYDERGFITNDPGTRKGEGFRYTYENLFGAIHDWDPSDILKGQKAFLVFD